MPSHQIPSRAFRPFHISSRMAMPEKETLLWISASPSLKYFDLPLLQTLNKSHSVARWEYQQSADEASSLETAVNLLVDYLKQEQDLEHNRSIHLAGHGISGVVALMAADRVPDCVKTLSLFGVAPQPGLTWQAHYYLQRLTMPCSQVRLLSQFCRSLFGSKMPHSAQTLVKLLGSDLNNSPSPHSLFRIAKLDSVCPQVPLLIFNGAEDFVISPDVAMQWNAVTKPGDRLVTIPEGQHFFHYHFSEQIAREMMQFWAQHTDLLTAVYSR